MTTGIGNKSDTSISGCKIGLKIPSKGMDAPVGSLDETTKEHQTGCVRAGNTIYYCIKKLRSTKKRRAHSKNGVGIYEDLRYLL